MLSTVPKSCWFSVAVFIISIACSSVEAMDHVTLRREGRTLYVEGRKVLDAQDGGVLLLARDGVLWRILPTELVKHAIDDTPFRAYPAEQMAKSVLRVLPKGFQVYRTNHYMICHNTSQTYAKWCGATFEWLYTAFRNTWKQRGFEMVDPEFPLVAVVFSDRASYAEFSKHELGDAKGLPESYYYPESNRLVMYDLTGRNKPGDAVSTMVHEATHQLAFNGGLHQRLSDCPKWFAEGIAMYYETPDPGRTKGLAGVGAVNHPRLAQFQQYLRQRPTDSLKTLISSDDRLIDVNQGLDAYAESWALTYYLIHKHPKQYVAYLKVLSRKRPLVYDEKATRLAEFEKEFGPLAKLDADFLNYVQTRVR